MEAQLIRTLWNKFYSEGAKPIRNMVCVNNYFSGELAEKKIQADKKKYFFLH